ncbi:MAG TPA: DUF4412 domain-containing protein [Terrimicrobiaceae bacterium]|nr:DUF4412 domain-containing protein [Terrimicrobiaceae bacterium]
MKTTLLVLLSAAALATVRADLTVTQEFQQESPAQKMTVTMKIKGDKVRMDGNPEVTTLIDVKSGDTKNLMHSQKKVMAIPGALIKQIQAAQSAGKSADKIAEPKATGRTETISGYACEEYEIDAEGTKIQVWLTKDLPAAQRVMSDLAKLSADADPLKGMLDGEKLEGFPMKTVIQPASGGKATVTVVALNEDPLPEADFEVPKGYEAMQMPGMPGR